MLGAPLLLRLTAAKNFWGTTMKYQFRLLGLVALLSLSSSVQAKPGKDSGQFLAHPLFNMPYKCSEHAAGELPYLGDALGQDCVPEEFVQKNGRAFMRAFKTDGLTNKDWYGWDQDVLSPCDCEIVSVHINPVTNQPGTMGEPPASSITLRARDGTSIVVAHIQSPLVKKGEKVKAGQKLATVGNNGMCRNPHIHIGAWRAEEPLQIRWDQTMIPII